MVPLNAITTSRTGNKKAYKVPPVTTCAHDLRDPHHHRHHSLPPVALWGPSNHRHNLQALIGRGRPTASCHRLLPSTAALWGRRRTSSASERSRGASCRRSGLPVVCRCPGAKGTRRRRRTPEASGDPRDPLCRQARGAPFPARLWRPGFGARERIRLTRALPGQTLLGFRPRPGRSLSSFEDRISFVAVSNNRMLATSLPRTKSGQAWQEIAGNYM